MAKAYRVKRGLNYPVRGIEKRAEPGDVVDDLPFKAIPWLIQRGHIEPVDEAEEGES